MCKDVVHLKRSKGGAHRMGSSNVDNVGFLTFRNSTFWSSPKNVAPQSRYKYLQTTFYDCRYFQPFVTGIETMAEGCKFLKPKVDMYKHAIMNNGVGYWISTRVDATHPDIYCQGVGSLRHKTKTKCPSGCLMLSCDNNVST
jgi:hypothetical protein